MSKLKFHFLIGILLFCSCTHRSDDEIETDVSVNIHSSAPDITVSVRDGVVILSGMVKDSASWRTTIEAAKSTKGVKSVTDKLHVANPRPVN